MLTTLAAVDGEFVQKGTPNHLLAQRAKRLVLALDRLANALSQNRGAPLKIDSELNQLFEDVKTLDLVRCARLLPLISGPSAKPSTKTGRDVSPKRPTSDGRLGTR